MKLIRQFGRHILHTVDRNIDFFSDHRILDLFDKKTLAAHLGQWDIKNLVPLGHDLDQLHCHIRIMLFQKALDPGALSHCQQTAPGPDPYMFLHEKIL